MKTGKAATVAILGALITAVAILTNTALAKVGPGVNASLNVPVPYSGSCPAKMTFSGHIMVGDSPNAKWKWPVDVRYRIIYSDGVRGAVQTRRFRSPNAQVVRFSRKFTASFNGWATIEILEPERNKSGRVPIKVNCKGSQKPQANKLPDLTIENIRLNANCQVVVTARNRGPGTVADLVWTRHTPASSSVYLTVNGRRWGGNTIWKFDPTRKLHRPGYTADYESTYVVIGTATVRATIDHTRQVTEQREDNNALTRRLSCGQAPRVHGQTGGILVITPG
jgi:hypothetical protein